VGVDYSPVGGIGIELTDEILGVLQKAVDLYEDKESLLGELELDYKEAGDGNYSGDENIFYIVAEGNNLRETTESAIELSKRLKELGVDISSDDFIVIQDLHVW
jgi:hypothetical protein